MQALARRFTPEELSGRAFALYESFRPEIAGGKAGWGQKGTLDLDRILRLAKK